MIYLVASLASLVMLAAGMSVIFLTVRASHGRIVSALLGQPVDCQTVLVQNTRARVRVKAPVHRPMQLLRAAA